MGNDDNKTKVFDEEEIESIECTSVSIDNSKKAALMIGLITWLGVSYYNIQAENFYGGIISYILLEIFFSSLSGFFWGGVAFFIAKFFKKDVKIIRIITKYSDVLDIKDEEVFSEHLFKNKQNSKENLEYSKNVSLDSKYDNLFKLNNLLEKGILSKEEFEKEKKNILDHS